MNSCKGKGGCKAGDNGCAGKNSCKGKGGCASADMKHSCKGMNSCKGQGGCKTRRRRLRRQELLQGQGRLRGPGGPEEGGLISTVVKPGVAAEAAAPGSLSNRKIESHVKPDSPETAGTFPTSASASACARSTIAHILEKKPEVDFFEVLSENYMDTGGRPALGPRPGRRALSGRAARRVDVDRQHRSARPRLPREAESPRRAHARPLGLRPPVLDRRRRAQHARPAADAATPRRRLRHVAERVKTVSDVLERPLILENASTYAEFAASTHAGVGVLRPAHGGGRLRHAPRRQQRLRQLVQPRLRPEALPRRDRPADRVAQYHLAGHTNKGTHILDTHNDRAIDEVWELYRHAVARTGNVATLFEWDARHPGVRGGPRRGPQGAARSGARRRPLPRRLLSCRSRASSAGCRRSSSSRARPRRPSTSPAARAELEPDDIARVILPSKTLTPVERVGVYQGMYLLRMVEALENDYPAVAHLLGAEDVRRRSSRATSRRTPRAATRSTAWATAFPSSSAGSQGIRRKAFVADLARLERAVTEVFDAPESPAWPAEEIARIPEEAWPGVVLVRSAAFRVARVRVSRQRLPAVGQGRRSRSPADRTRSPTWVAVYRKNYEVWRLDLSKPAYDFLRALVEGPAVRQGRRRGGAGAPGHPRATSSSAGCATGSPRACSQGVDPAGLSLSAAILAADA